MLSVVRVPGESTVVFYISKLQIVPYLKRHYLLPVIRVVSYRTDSFIFACLVVRIF